jgi:DNA-binding HxlR family transcriptional regulator
MASALDRRYACGVELALEVLGGKWGVVLLARLKEGPLRYGALRALVPRISDRMLTARLTDLAERGLVARGKQGGRGARSVYRLTARGEALRPALQALHDLGVRLAPEVGAVLDEDEPAPRRPAGAGRARRSPAESRAPARAED